MQRSRDPTRHRCRLADRRGSGTLCGMPKFTGTVRHNELEGGFLELATDEGDVYRLEGKVDVEAGTRVRVTGKLEEGGFGIQMTGPAITVERIEKL
jgi:Protein of unknown function (DUF5818)